MDASLANLLAELERFGEANDSATDERAQRMLNITRDTGEFLALLVRATAARRILEIGTSNGYSTLWLADAALSIGARVTTLEFLQAKFDLAAQNFARTPVAECIEQVLGDAGTYLAKSPDSAFDLVFLDSARSDYTGWWPDLKRVIRPGGLLVVDNALSHADEMAPFIAMVQSDPDYTTCLVPVGKGEFLATR